MVSTFNLPASCFSFIYKLSFPSKRLNENVRRPLNTIRFLRVVFTFWDISMRRGKRFVKCLRCDVHSGGGAMVHSSLFWMNVNKFVKIRASQATVVWHFSSRYLFKPRRLTRDVSGITIGQGTWKKRRMWIILRFIFITFTRCDATIDDRPHINVKI